MFQIRPYNPKQASDIDAVYEICLATADNGNDGSHLFHNPKLNGDFYAVNYAVLEPTLCFLLEDVHGVCGYIVGALDTETFNNKMNTSWLPKLRKTYPKLADSAYKSPTEKRLIEDIHSELSNDEQLDEQLNDYPSHLHIDLLPRAQKQGQGKLLMIQLWQALKNAGSPGVHLGVGKGNTNAVGFYKAIGYQPTIEFENAIIMTKAL